MVEWWQIVILAVVVFVLFQIASDTAYRRGWRVGKDYGYDQGYERATIVRRVQGK